ncbi:MAG TPA: type VI secretion system baseplate subunit TssE [Burkholderiaceae bacterium]|nr:type VI secretion system baseplate subunit TssE [Burkholderiaceae bacterium]
MPELTLQERLQPALLDRLTDDAPDRKIEPPEARVINTTRLRAAVLRDLRWLLNAVRPREADVPAGYPYAAQSVLCFGLPALTGETSSTLDGVALQQSIREAILRYEPRVLPDSLVVEVIGSPGGLEHNVIGIEIRGHLWAQPIPLEILLRADVDLEDATYDVRERGRAVS